MSTDRWTDARKDTYTQTHTESDANTRRQTLTDRHTQTADLSLAIKLSCPVSASTHFFMFPLLWHISTSTRHSTAPRYTTLHCTTLHFTELHCNTLHYTTLHRSTPHYAALISSVTTDPCYPSRQAWDVNMRDLLDGKVTLDIFRSGRLLRCVVVQFLIYHYFVFVSFVLAYLILSYLISCHLYSRHRISFTSHFYFSHFNHLPLWNLIIIHLSESLLCSLCDRCVGFSFFFLLFTKTHQNS